jgi:hypothetical protein
MKKGMHMMRAFMSLIKEKDTGEYIESLLTYFAAPTIQGLKPGSLINLRRGGDDGIVAAWCSRKEELLRKFRVEALALSSRVMPNDSAMLLMLYKKGHLARALFSEKAVSILNPLGYEKCIPCVDACLERLKARFMETREMRERFLFPHEIGLFLGYPPEDVEGFIRDKGKSPLAVGYWKVYGNVRRARRTFRIFRRAEHRAVRSIIRREQSLL